MAAFCMSERAVLNPTDKKHSARQSQKCAIRVLQEVSPLWVFRNCSIVPVFWTSARHRQNEDSLAGSIDSRSYQGGRRPNSKLYSSTQGLSLIKDTFASLDHRMP